MVLVSLGCFRAGLPTKITKGLVIRSSVDLVLDSVEQRIQSIGYDDPVIVIEGEDIVVDFGGMELIGNDAVKRPNQFKGLGILVRNGRNITIKNLTVRGFKMAVMADGVDGLIIEDGDFSYNYRPKLYSTRERESLTDWMSYHINDEDEWLDFGSAVYLTNCNNFTIKDVTIKNGQNGIMLDHSNHGLVYNNTIQFNSGLGIALYQSSKNRIMHNKLDWNVRGHSPGFYARGQDSAGILVYEQSNENVFAFNSATHSGDGFFLWAGQTTMDSGEGGCNDNIIYKNDFSYAPTNGIEVTFSRNAMIQNVMKDCRYGIWGGYSFESLMYGNEIETCEYGIAIEHGQDNVIANNLIKQCTTGVQLWERLSQPGDWGYANAKDISSRDYEITGNWFAENPVALSISASTDINVNQGNLFEGFDQWLESKAPNEEMDVSGNYVMKPVKPGSLVGFSTSKNELVSKASFQYEALAVGAKAQGVAYLDTISPLPDGMDVSLPEAQLTGRDFILVDKWGPYNFSYPSIWLRKVEGDEYTFLVLGPTGNWQLNGGAGFTEVNPKRGSYPATITAKAAPEADFLSLKFMSIGSAMEGQFGEVFPKGTPYNFSFEKWIAQPRWEVKFYNLEHSDTIPPSDKALATQLRKDPVHETQETDLAYRWWREPAPNVDPDHFLTVATSRMDMEPGDYRIVVTSDDGVKIFVDEKLVHDHWTIHTPETDEIILRLDGLHDFKVLHFENGGLATLDFRIEKVENM